MRGYKVRCPHCSSDANVRNSKQVTDQYKELTFACSNVECGFVWVATISPVRTLSPSSIPNPEIRIPLSPHIKRGALQAMLDEPSTT